MEHIPILFSFLSLISGIACLGRLVLLYQQNKNTQRLALLVFFSSFSYVMIVAAMFGYWFINVDSSEAAQTTFAGLNFTPGAGAVAGSTGQTCMAPLLEHSSDTTVFYFVCHSVKQCFYFCPVGFIFCFLFKQSKGRIKILFSFLMFFN